MELRKSHSTSLTSIEEASDLAAQLPTPQDTPVPKSFSRPKISNTLFDNPNVFLDAGDGTRSRVYTTASGNMMLTIIDQSGIFEMEAVFCVCSKDANCDKLLLQIGLFPSTFISIKTIFTFAVLDNFLKDNLECKTNNSAGSSWVFFGPILGEGHDFPLASVRLRLGVGWLLLHGYEASCAS